MTEVPASLTARDCDELVFISQSAMQLCKMQIGEPVIVRGDEHSVVKSVWPTSEKSLLSVLLTKAGNKFICMYVDIFEIYIICIYYLKYENVCVCALIEHYRY